MEDIELVIKIPEVFYEALRKTDVIVSEQRSGKTLMSVIYNAVAKGTLIPKGHGDLIDRDDLLADSYCIDDWSGNEVNIIDVMTVNMAETIIEADTEEREDKQ